MLKQLSSSGCWTSELCQAQTSACLLGAKLTCIICGGASALQQSSLAAHDTSRLYAVLCMNFVSQLCC